MITIGIDPASTKLAMVAILPSGSYISQTATNLSGGKKRTPWSPAACAAAGTITAQFLNVLHESWPSEPIHAFIESPVVGRAGPRATMVQAFTSGAIQAQLVQGGATVELVNVSSWKRDIVGHGHASKDDVAECLRLRWPTFVRGAGGDQDLHDAAAIAIWGKDHFPD
jgi:Holliday junction resolvasome RuvABC endonuclease subunit